MQPSPGDPSRWDVARSPVPVDVGLSVDPQALGEDLISTTYILAPHTTREMKHSRFDSSYNEYESERGYTETNEYKESVDRVVYSQISSSCSARTLPGYGPTRPPCAYRKSG